MRNEGFNSRSRRPDPQELSGRLGSTRRGLWALWGLCALWTTRPLLAALASLLWPALLVPLLVTQGCTSTWVDQQGHGEAARKALQAQRISQAASSPGSAATGPTLPAATELQGALQNHLRAPASNAGQALTPVLPEAGR